MFKELPSTLEEIDAQMADVQARMDLIFVDSDRRVRTLALPALYNPSRHGNELTLTPLVTGYGGV